MELDARAYVSIFFVILCGLIRAAILLVKFQQQRRSALVVEMLAKADSTGLFEVSIQNRSSESFSVDRLVLVRDSSRWKFLVRRVVGIDRLFSQKMLAWTPSFRLPHTMPGHKTEKFYAQLDSSLSIGAFRKAWLWPLYVSATAAGYKKLIKVRIEEKVFGSDAEADSYLKGQDEPA